MAEKTEFLQAIDDAILDADSLERFINGSEDETVLTRLSAQYPTLQKALKELLENGGIAGRFKTLTELQSSSLVDGDYALVADDVADKNGIYIKEGGSWVKSKYDPAADASLYAKLLQSEYFKPTSKNIFDESTFISGGYISSTGDIAPQELSSYSQRFSVKPSTIYTASTKTGGAGVSGVAYYSFTGDFISRHYPVPTTNFQFTTPSNCGFIAINVTSGSIENKIMINEGGAALPYEPYAPPELVNASLPRAVVDSVLGEVLKLPKSKAELLLEKSLSNKNNLYNYEDEGMQSGKAISPSKLEIADNSSYTVSHFIIIKPNTDYTVSSESLGFKTVAFFDLNKNMVSTLPLFNESATKTFTTPLDSYYMVLDMTQDPKLGKRMVNEGSTALPYDDGIPTFKGLHLEKPVINGVEFANSSQEGGGRVGEYIYFTGDKHPAPLLDFPDSHSKNDVKPIIYSSHVTYQYMVDMWQGLVDEFPDYITKKKIGTDSSGTYDVHSYTFTPSKPYRQGGASIVEPAYPRVMLIVQHIERLNQMYPYLAMREICRKWADHPTLAALRNEVEFVVIPYVHPYGLGGGDYRITSEGLNINGDWPLLWSHVDDPLNGDAPFATQEARNVKAVAEQFKPHVFLDLHANTWTEETKGMWMEVTHNPRYEATARLAVQSLYPSIVKNDPEAESINELLMVTYSTGARLASGYGYSIGATGGLMEFVSNYKGVTKTDGLYNDGLVMSSSFLISLIVQCIAEYRDYGSPNKGELYSGSGVYNPDA